MRFKIGKEELQKRSKNIKIGGLLAAILVLFIYYHNNQFPDKYNDVLYWSMMCFLILTNLVGFYRYRRYLRMAKDHWIEIHPKQIQFYSNGEISKLNSDDIAALNFYRRKGNLQHIQIKLKNNRGVRLEGYENFDELAGLLSELVPEAHISANN